MLCLEEKDKNTNTHKTKVHCFFFTCFHKNLFKCLHLSISSDFLFNLLLSLIWSIIQSFSVKHKNALYESGFKEELKYTPSHKSFQEANGRRTRRRKIIWFNPPHSRSVKTNIGKNFSRLLVKHFPANNKMHKTFNKNTVKVSYICMKIWIQSYLNTTITY